MARSEFTCVTEIMVSKFCYEHAMWTWDADWCVHWSYLVAQNGASGLESERQDWAIRCMDFDEGIGWNAENNTAIIFAFKWGCLPFAEHEPYSRKNSDLRRRWLNTHTEKRCPRTFFKFPFFWSFCEKRCCEESAVSGAGAYSTHKHNTVCATNAILIKWIKYPGVRQVVVAANMRSLGQQPATGRGCETTHAMSWLFPQAWGDGALYYSATW